MIKRFLSSLLSFIILISLTSCESKLKLFSKTYFDYFDTVITIKAYCTSQDDFQKLCKITENDIKKYYKLFDIYNNYDGLNNLKTINDFAGEKEIFVDKEIIDFLNYCKEIYSLTKGYVNICLGSVLKIWHSYREEGKTLPKTKILKNADKYSDINNLEINYDEKTVFLKKSQSSLDVGAIAKGYVAEIVKEKMLKSKLSENFIIDFGGNIIACGKKSNGEKFSVGVADPDNTEKSLLTIKAFNKAVVTSGDYQRFYLVNGKKYSHIISPKTLYPAENNRSVTVIAENAPLADALSTALFIMKTDEAIEFVNSIQDCEVLIIDIDNNLHFSNGFEKYIK